MSTATHEAAAKVLADLLQSGGGTYVAGTLRPIRPTHGYAVAVGGVKVRSDKATIGSIAFLGEYLPEEHGTHFFGTWLDKGIVYIDAVRIDLDRATAIERGRAHGQVAIYDFAAKEAIEL